MHIEDQIRNMIEPINIKKRAIRLDKQTLQSNPIQSIHKMHESEIQFNSSVSQIQVESKQWIIIKSIMLYSIVKISVLSLNPNPNKSAQFRRKIIIVHIPLQPRQQDFRKSTTFLSSLSKTLFSLVSTSKNIKINKH